MTRNQVLVLIYGLTLMLIAATSYRAGVRSVRGEPDYFTIESPGTFHQNLTYATIDEGDRKSVV